jgi:hypothetical protein
LDISWRTKHMATALNGQRQKELQNEAAARLEQEETDAMAERAQAAQIRMVRCPPSNRFISHRIHVL